MKPGAKDYGAITATINKGIKGLCETDTEDTVSKFTAMAKTALADGALDGKTKRLIALAIGAAKQCDGCIGFHTKALKHMGATDAEVSEALGMVIYMGGGPGLMYAAEAWTAWQALQDD